MENSKIMATKLEPRGSLDNREGGNKISLRITNGTVLKTVRLQPITKTVAQAKPGQMYIALDGGRLVPVEPCQFKSVTTSQEAANKSIVPSSSKLNIQSNTSFLDDTINESSETTVKFKKEEVGAEIRQEQKETVGKVNTKRETEDEVTEERKKFRAESSIGHLDPNLDNQFHDDEQETKFEDDDEKYDEFYKGSLAGSEDITGSTPEDIYDNLDDEEGECADYTDSQNEELESDLYDDQEEYINEECGEDIAEDQTSHNSLQSITTESHKQYGELNILQPNIYKKIVTGQQINTSSSQSAYLRRAGVTKVHKWGAIHKTPRINDRFPELPVPANINQYGDCLKTRLGRYHYGLTLNDPPCQFFQGVLKGASGLTLAAMFGDTNLISKFENVPLDDIGHFSIDTTFKVIPNTTEGVNQVLTISLLYQNQIIPLWYAITSCSSPELYKRILIEFQQHVLDWPFTSILINNDPALCKAIRAVFPNIDLYGSWFHYCYGIWKEINFHSLMEQCKIENSTLMTAVKLLMVVPFLPPTTSSSSCSVTMVDGFQYVRDFARENTLPEEFNRVLDYVAAFWFNKVKVENFTVFGKHTCAINYVEVLQLSLLSYMKPNGNVWTLTRSFQAVAKTTNTEFNRYLNGKRLQIKKNRGKRFNVAIRQNIKKLLTGTLDVKTYLEKCTIYLEEILDIFLHPLYPSTAFETTSYVHTEGWRIRICSD